MRLAPAVQLLNSDFRAIWRRLMRNIGIAALAIAAFGCTSAVAAEPASYSSLAGEYRNLTCAQLAQEGHAISKRGFALSGLKAGLGGTDGTATAPTTVIVWPATASVDDKQRSENLALALRQMDAAEQASIASQCSIQFLRPLAK
jgi:hypothetical protein